MTNNNQKHGKSEIVLRILLNDAEHEAWHRQDWKAAGARGGAKHEARKLYRNTGGRKVEILGAPEFNDGKRRLLWTSEGDSVCIQMQRNGHVR